MEHQRLSAPKAAYRIVSGAVGGLLIAAIFTNGGESRHAGELLRFAMYMGSFIGFLATLR